jgi:large repetitive protein
MPRCLRTRLPIVAIIASSIGWGCDRTAGDRYDELTRGYAAVLVSPTNGITSEGGGWDLFLLALRTRPTANVTIPIASDDEREGTVSPLSVVFTPLNWSTPQEVTVFGIDDQLEDGDRVYHVVTSAATSDDPDYDGLNPSDVTLTNLASTARMVPQFLIPLTMKPVTTEGGGTASFTIALNRAPSADVVLLLASTDPAEGKVSPSSMTFTPENWNALRSFVVPGQDDDVADGNKKYTIVMPAARSADRVFNGTDPPDITLENIDNESPGIRVAPMMNLVTDESGKTDSFAVFVNSKPADLVTILITSSDDDEGRATPASLLFTSNNFKSPQTVTVSGVDDHVADGAKQYSVLLTAMSADPSYDKIDIENVHVVNQDNDAPGFVASLPTGELITSEGGQSASFTMRLNRAPIKDVVIRFLSSNMAEARVTPASLVFTPSNWEAPQGVTVQGIDDSIADGDQPYEVVGGKAESEDPAYNGSDVPDLSGRNLDDDTAGITVKLAGGTTDETGRATTIALVLNSRPKASVVVDMQSNAPTEGVASPIRLVFMDTNWKAPQTVTVTGVDDHVADGNQRYRIRAAPDPSTADADYANLPGVDVWLTNMDNESAGIVVSSASGTTTESGGSATFSVRLASQPMAIVALELSSSDSTEGALAIGALTFTPNNWSAPQHVTVTGVNDDIADGNQPFTVVLGPTLSSDPAYDGIDPADVSLSNVDDDSPGIVVTPFDLQTSESGDLASFSIRLTSQPLAIVSVALETSDPTEGIVSTDTVLFTPTNYSSPQTVTVSGVDDNEADGNQPYRIILHPAQSVDPGYQGRDPADLSFTNIDNDSAGITVGHAAGPTGEDGTTTTFSVFLNSRPSADVSIALSSSDLTEGAVSPTVLTITPDRWATPHMVTVTGVDDSIADGNQPYRIVLGPATSADANYKELRSPDVELTNIDDDSPGVIVSPPSGLVTGEAGGVARFTARLTSRPTATVVLALRTSDNSEGGVGVAALTFTPSDYAVVQTVVVTGADDNLPDGNQEYRIIIGPSQSADASYHGLDPPDVIVTNIDNDPPGGAVCQAPSDPAKDVCEVQP